MASSFLGGLFSSPKTRNKVSDTADLPSSSSSFGKNNESMPLNVQVIQVDLNAVPHNEEDEDLLFQDLAVPTTPGIGSVGAVTGAAYGSVAATTGGEGEDHQFTLLMRHDSEFSVGSDYESVKPGDHGAPPLLNYWQGAVLLTADCLGTGLLALPGNIKVIGFVTGLTFLILNAPINLFAGTILAHSATTVEKRQQAANRVFTTALREHGTYGSSLGVGMGMTGGGSANTYNPSDTAKSFQSVLTIESTPGHLHQKLHHDTATFDFVGMTQALFKNKAATRLVQTLFYCNIFLVMGNYILVMSHSVIAMFGEGTMCIPVAGLIAATFMYGVSQSRTMARLGRTASVFSLTALFIVICQCLYATQTMEQQVAQQQQQQDDTGDHVGELFVAAKEHESAPATTAQPEPTLWETLPDTFRILSALGSIGFAMGSQKLFLNIRHELHDRKQAPLTLALSLVVFTTVYTFIIVLAGDNPPGFLFDAIPPGWNRRVAGFLLWGHVVVSYAINSQAICSSMDRLFWHRVMPHSVSPTVRWLTLTAIMSVTAYTVANAIPFFQDLVGLIGAMTAVPLTLLLPAIFWRKQLGVPIWIPTHDTVASWLLLAFSVVYMVTATAGAFDSISEDWKKHGGRPFACVK